MTKRVADLLGILNKKEYRKKRRACPDFNFADPAFAKNQALNFKSLSVLEAPVIHGQDRFGFNRSTDVIVHGSGNFTPDYFRVISCGFDKIADEIKESMKKADSKEKLEYGSAMLDCISTVFDIADKYKVYARKTENTALFNALSNIPHKGASSFYEALVFMKLSLYCLRLEHTTHLTLGSFDNYMYPFFRKDKENGATDEELFELVEEFFISINFDTDLYPGIQQGDNGQSMILGGFDENKNCMYNELSEMCMNASLELNLIDPKINLRVGKNTPDSLYEFATRLTKKGLGFPQYCNDDIVVDGLTKLGYDRIDAINYTVAACWEYIIPGKGADIPNIAVMDFPRLINDVIKDRLLFCEGFEELLQVVKEKISDECENIAAAKLNYSVFPTVLASAYFDGPTHNLKDVFCGGVKYNNYGCHGAGISNATDALCAVKTAVYDNKAISKETLLEAVDANFEGFAKERNLLLACPKMGNNDRLSNEIASLLMDTFSENMNGRDNGHGGIWRAGTGSAMEYIFKGRLCPATCDGRKAKEPYASSFSPSIGVKTDGILSVIQSFTNYDMTKIINGGPLTLELHDTIFRNDIGIYKTAMLVKEFIKLGGHQLQLNSVNAEKLRDAQIHPENYPNLIVRVWGWSGYFNELHREYQNHIIRRAEYEY